ncbi:MAG: tripartite tricarboxylate transporter substrate binding protein [Burkholderiaceae bacterium]
MQRRSLLLGATALLPGMGFSQSADWPRAGSTVRYVVPFPPGGLTDVMARLVGEQLGKRWNVNVVVDNKPGSGGMIGADAVAKAAPDGNTILATTMSHAVNATLFKGKAPYDLQKDLRAVALLAGSPMLVVVPATSPIRDFRALMDAAKSKPLNGGSSGNGTPPHLTLAFFNQLTGSAIQHVPYKGGAPSMTDLIGGQLDVIFSNFPESIAHVKSGKLRALAIASTARHPAVPDVPTSTEAGLPELQVENWTGIMAPAALPDAITTKLGNEAVAIMKTPEMAEKAGTQGFRVDARPAAEFARFLNAEVDRWAKVIVAAKISAD